jgi:N6-L-threonylcarbamoyladenine synthase
MLTLGIDTSNYTTSAAVFDGENYEMSRKILDVKEGSRGIRQSDGVFIHNREMPQMIEERLNGINEKISAVGVSTRPRSVEDSYMPVFTVGHGYARAVSAALGVPLYEFSHQDGHIMAGIYSARANELLEKPFISVHLSGGTTEILRSEYDGYNFKNEIIGGTLDISAGQLIDRVGVAMGLKFPCGKALEELALSADKCDKLPFSVKGAYMNLSGIETKLIRKTDGADAKTARTVLCYIRDALIKTIGDAVKETGIKEVLIAGGVASNSIIRDGITNGLDANTHFASKELSTDNAAGIAILAHNAAFGLGEV